MATKTTNGNGNYSNGNGNGNGVNGIGGLSWGNAREIIMIMLILIGGWWGLVYSPINEKFQNFKEADVAIVNKLDNLSSEVRKQTSNFVTKVELENEKRELERKIDSNTAKLGKLHENTLSMREFKLYAEPGERRMNVLEQSYISRDAFKMWEDKNTQINQILQERITALSARLNELERRLAITTTTSPAGAAVVGGAAGLQKGIP